MKSRIDRPEPFGEGKSVVAGESGGLSRCRGQGADGGHDEEDQDYYHEPSRACYAASGVLEDVDEGVACLAF